MTQETMVQSTFDNTYNNLTPDVFKDPLFGELRVFINPNKQVWFVGYEVATRLGYSNPRDAISKHVNNQYRLSGVAIRDGSSSQNRLSTLIHEKGVYELCMKSQLQEAKRFQDWVYTKIQDMRQYGVAMSDQFANAIRNCNDINQLQNMVLAKQQALDEAQPAIHMYHQAINDDATITTRQIADNYGWVLYEKYKDQGLVNTIKRETREGIFDFTTGYTEKGRNLVDQILHENGYRTRYETQTETDRRIQIANDRANQFNQPSYSYKAVFNNYIFASPNPDDTWRQIQSIPDPTVRLNALKAFSNHIHNQSNTNCPLLDKNGNPF